MTAKDKFLEGISVLLAACGSQELSPPPAIGSTNLTQNKIASLFSNGIAIKTFIALEDFIKHGTAQSLRKIDSTLVPFADLPAKLQEASTHNILDTLSYQLKNNKQIPNKISYFQDIAEIIASTKNRTYQLPPIMFGHAKSNIQSSDLENICDSLSIESVWQCIKKINLLIGITGPVNYADQFQKLSQDRHLAAHNNNHSVPLVDLKNNIKYCTEIALGIDYLTALGIKRINNRSAHPPLRHSEIKSIPGYKIEEKLGKWKIYKDPSTQTKKAVRTFNAKEDAYSYARGASKSGDLIVLIGQSGIEDWYIC